MENRTVEIKKKKLSQSSIERIENQSIFIELFLNKIFIEIC